MENFDPSLFTAQMEGQMPELMAAGAAMMGLFFAGMALLIFVLISCCFLFRKAGWKWYEALISGHNSVVFLQIAHKPIWWFFTVLIPFLANLIGGFLGGVLAAAGAETVGGVLAMLFSLAGFVAFLWIHVLVLRGIARSFGKGTGFTVGLFFLPFIFLPILAFGEAKYTPVKK